MEECTEARKAVEAWIDGELGVGEEADLQTHLAACASCAGEVEERRSFSRGLGSGLRESLQAVRGSAPERRALVDRLTAASRPRLGIAPRIAAAVTLVAGLGIVAYTLGWFRKSDLPVARTATDDPETRARYARLLDEIERMTQEVRAQLPSKEEGTPADWTAALELATLEDQLCQIAYREEFVDPPSDLQRRVEGAMRDLGGSKSWIRAGARRSLRSLPKEAVPVLEKVSVNAGTCDRWFLDRLLDELRDGESAEQQKVVVRHSQGDEEVEVQQFGDARVELVIAQRGRQQKISARNMTDLLRRHRDTCRRFSISGFEGWVAVGDLASGMDLEGQLGLLFRSGESVDFAPVRSEAYAGVLAKRLTDAAQVQDRVRTIESKFRQAEKVVSGLDPDEREIRRIRSKLDALKSYVEAVQAAKR